ncbi:hypothetical protein IGI04_042999 [Brassica rapa subsp. trilocularis]|uniref:Uncharacterized protein n=1 Tax=Brassica rapa subsp. trilocularis TaxID=1813537 RepID=A0ABQ7KKD3_BRACM|nr:hypothetical protein IGI04_042999 [Brassica rapa subsp. trilocularis]
MLSVHVSACWPFPWTVRVLIRVLIRVLNSYQHADHTYQHSGPSRGLSVMLTTHISMLALPVDCPCTDFGQLMHHVSTHISHAGPSRARSGTVTSYQHGATIPSGMLALPVDCSVLLDLGQLIAPCQFTISMLGPLPVD